MWITDPTNVSFAEADVDEVRVVMLKPVWAACDEHES